jgi:flagellar motor switch protein FliG
MTATLPKTPDAGAAVPALASRPALPSMTALEQAAILLLSLGDSTSAGVLRHFSREEIVAVSQAMARLNNVKQPMVLEVIGRFFNDYKEQSSIKGASRSYLESMLGKALGGDITRSLLDSIYALIAKEHAQMQAVFLAFLPPAMASEVLEHMPGWRQDELLFRIANLSDINADVIRELEQLIERSLSVLSSQGSVVRGVKQAADIMNRFKGDRAQMFELLPRGDSADRLGGRPERGRTGPGQGDSRGHATPADAANGKPDAPPGSGAAEPHRAGAQGDHVAGA